MNQTTLFRQRGPHLAAAHFAIRFDRDNPDRAGQYPEPWASRIERARAAGFQAEDPVQDRDYWRAWESDREERMPVIEVPREDPFASEEPPLPYAGDRAYNVPTDPVSGFFGGMK